MNNLSDNAPNFGMVMFILYVFAMCLVGLFLDGSNSGMRDKIYDLTVHLQKANDEIDRLEEMVSDKDDKIAYLEQTLDNLRDALSIRDDLNNPNKRRRLDQDM
jgi:hypothetical protein